MEMRYIFFKVILLVFFSCGIKENSIVINEIPASGEFTLMKTSIKIPQADLDFAVYRDELGYKRIDRDKFDVNNQGYVLKEYEAIILENQFIKLTILPKLGKPYSLIYKITGNEQFFIPKIAHIHYSPNKLGWWFMLGGIEYTLPDQEHGDSWAADWEWLIAENSESKKTVRLKVKELRFGLEETIDISILPDKAYYQADLKIINPTDSTIHFQHWINPMWTPGGTGELTANTEFIIPTKEVYATERTLNNWMLDFHPEGKRQQSYAESPMRYFNNWLQACDLLAWRLDFGFYSAFSHDQNEGIVRVFPQDINPGCNIWTFGFNPKPGISELFSGDSTHAGYVEMWGGITHGFDKYFPLEAGESISWTEWIYPYHKTEGLHFANENFAVTFSKDADNAYRFALCPGGLIQNVLCRVISEESQDKLFEIDIKSTFPKQDILEYIIPEGSTDGVLVISQNGQEIIRLQPRTPKVLPHQ